MRFYASKRFLSGYYGYDVIEQYAQVSARKSSRVSIREKTGTERLVGAPFPERLPAIDGAVFHAAYRPASDESEVGGDWFDSFTLSDGRVAISVGDVAGRGLDAAVIMGEVRQAIRAAAVGAENSAEVLRYVNRIVLLRQSLGIVTALFGIYDPRTSLLMYASAGHPPPFLALAGGLVKALPSAGLPLGCIEDLGSREWAFTVPHGGHVIFYTDGLVENERDVINGEKQLVQAVRAIVCNGSPKSDAPSDPALAIQEFMFRGAANRDDAAVLMLSRTARVPYYVFSAVPLVASLSRAIVGNAMDELDVPGERRFGVLVAVGEAIANAIEHAYSGTDPGLLRLEVGGDGNHVALSVEDFGCWRPCVRRAERGRGFEIMHAFMDRVQIESTRESTKVVLKAELA
jgi:serine phosphatase RsbU (regulator of sigma subunit)/anti-sigma regulatory factor (Ser/Thr protein kinase)